MSVLDDAFGLAKNAYNIGTHAKAKTFLQKKHPSSSQEEINDAYKRGRNLADACYDIADLCRENMLSEEGAIGRMREEFPGFSEETYKNALHYGYFVSR